MEERAELDQPDTEQHRHDLVNRHPAPAVWLAHAMGLPIAALAGHVAYSIVASRMLSRGSDRSNVTSGRAWSPTPQHVCARRRIALAAHARVAQSTEQRREIGRDPDTCDTPVAQLVDGDAGVAADVELRFRQRLEGLRGNAPVAGLVSRRPGSADVVAGSMVRFVLRAARSRSLGRGLSSHCGMRVPLFKDRPSLRPPASPTWRVLVVLSPTEADVHPVRALWRRLRPLGVALVAASECHGEVQGESGARLTPNLLLVDAATQKWDAVIVAGGRGARKWPRINWRAASSPAPSTWRRSEPDATFWRAPASPVSPPATRAKWRVWLCRTLGIVPVDRPGACRSSAFIGGGRPCAVNRS